MKKVYCENCEYNGFKCKHFRHRINVFTGERATMTTQELREKYKDINDTGECPYYKRKWYKFWIK